MFALFDHTADIGIHVEADDPAALFAEAGRGLAAVLVERPETVRTTETVRIRVADDDLACLMVDWLNELLYLFETRRLLLTEFDVTLRDGALTATARGERWDEARHHLEHEVKAITYHGLDVRRMDKGWEADVIVDV